LPEREHIYLEISEILTAFYLVSTLASDYSAAFLSESIEDGFSPLILVYTCGVSLITLIKSV
jgi:hypothetical protein